MDHFFYGFLWFVFVKKVWNVGINDISRNQLKKNGLSLRLQSKPYKYLLDFRCIWNYKMNTNKMVIQ